MIASCKRHILLTNTILIAFITILAMLIWLSGDWFFAGSIVTFGPLHNYVFIWISILIASVAALNAILSSLIARDSQRPFLNVSRVHLNWSNLQMNCSNINNFIIGVENTGNFPADEVSIRFSVWKSEKGSQKHLFVMKEESQIYFPNEDKPNIHFSEPDEENKLSVTQEEKVQIEVEIYYKNKLTHSCHKTTRLFQTQFTQGSYQEPTPLSGGDFWN
ncbi:hypothetical protein ACFLUJ_06920 [Chloroflexota bacterium]